MSVEKKITDDTVTTVDNSEAVQVSPELPNEENNQVKSSETKHENIEESVKNEQALEEPSEIIDAVETAESSIEVEEENIELSGESTTEIVETEAEDKSNEVLVEISEKETETIVEEPLAEEINVEEALTEEDELIEEEIDYSTLDKEHLLIHISDIAQNFNLKKAGEPTNEIRDAFNSLVKLDEEAALKKFTDEGGKKEDFKFFAGNEKIKFDEAYKIIKEKRHHHYKNLEKDKDQNLKLKNELLERLREVIDNEESTSINTLKRLQDEWKSIGPVHQQHNRTLWANYHALLDRFYDNRSIYFELKDLDRKKNLEAKLELCKKAEALNDEVQVNVAIKKLNELHEEFRHFGPVPREEQEALWTRFKTASDLVYSKRKEYTAELIEQLKSNLVIKLDLVDQMNEFVAFNSNAIGEWNTKTKGLLELQKKWESTGAMPRENSKDVNKKFWAGFKQFFNNKNNFFKSLDAQREANLVIKQELVTKAEALQNNEDWDKTSNELVKLQNEWKNSGPVPEKYRNKLYKQFKTACDTFFTNRRSHNKVAEAEYGNNLTKKEAVCEQLEAMTDDGAVDAPKVYALQDSFNSIGFVPRNSMKKIQNRYKNAVQGVLKNVSNLSENELTTFRTSVTINDVRSGPDADKKIQRQEIALKRKISNLENDISTWKNNLGFFANSKNAADLLKDFEQKIVDAESDVVKLKAELKILQSA